MTQPRHTSLTLRTQVVSFVEGLDASDAKDTFASDRFVNQLSTLKAQLDKDGFHEAGVLGAVATRIAEILSHGEGIEGEHAHELLRMLALGIAASVGVEVDRPKPAKSAETSDAAAERPALRMVSSRKLGEILVQMSLLTPQQVEQALAHQRMTGCRLGEALIEMRIVPKTTIDNVLRVQGSRKQSYGDPWRAVS